jgi:HEAT repeat protein
MVVDRNPEKADAAVAALIKLGDENTIEQLRMKLKDTEGMARYRVAHVMFELGDKEAGGILREELMEVPSLQLDSARTLASKGDAKAMQYLRDWLTQSRDPSEPVLIQRSLATYSLIKAGDRTNAGVLQDVLREGSPRVQVTALKLIADLDLHALLPMILPVLNGNDPTTVVVACQAAVAMAHNDYGTRLRGQL